ncbi:hypothetical protein JTE90_021454 [Oedothorax gibbosus]|uniref:Mutator-like transposase domain-containing protein n=1 Tax=Oedothorax gibbosus TaxID=931172 RepID=A0AAV6VY69_9ARAC|nr:hypothetical protein JTE90_021454 [Oedothorax gibbosus]
MNSICSRFHKLKGRPTKRKKALAANLNRRWAERSAASSNDSTAESNSQPNSEDCTIPEIHKERAESNYLMMSQQVWSTLLNNIPCSECKGNSLSLVQHQSYGFARKIELVCKNCKRMHGSVFASERVESNDKTFDINNKMVEALLAIGKGHAALETFAMILGTPSMDRKTFTKCLHNLHSQTEESNLVVTNSKDIRNLFVVKPSSFILSIQKS